MSTNNSLNASNTIELLRVLGEFYRTLPHNSGALPAENYTPIVEAGNGFVGKSPAFQNALPR